MKVSLRAVNVFPTNFAARRPVHTKRCQNAGTSFDPAQPNVRHLPRSLPTASWGTGAAPSANIGANQRNRHLTGDRTGRRMAMDFAFTCQQVTSTLPRSGRRGLSGGNAEALMAEDIQGQGVLCSRKIVAHQVENGMGRRDTSRGNTRVRTVGDVQEGRVLQYTGADARQIKSLHGWRIVLDGNTPAREIGVVQGRGVMQSRDTDAPTCGHTQAENAYASDNTAANKTAIRASEMAPPRVAVTVVNHGNSNAFTAADRRASHVRTGKREHARMAVTAADNSAGAFGVRARNGPAPHERKGEGRTHARMDVSQSDTRGDLCGGAHAHAQTGGRDAANPQSDGTHARTASSLSGSDDAKVIKDANCRAGNGRHGHCGDHKGIETEMSVSLNVLIFGCQSVEALLRLCETEGGRFDSINAVCGLFHLKQIVGNHKAGGIDR